MENAEESEFHKTQMEEFANQVVDTIASPGSTQELLNKFGELLENVFEDLELTSREKSGRTFSSIVIRNHFSEAIFASRNVANCSSRDVF